jgi:hypothetical protein
MNIRTAGVRDQTHGTETREIGTNTLRRSFFVNWSSRYDFCALCTGDEALWTDTSVTPNVVRLSRLLPDPTYGTHPDYPELVATKIESIRGANSAGTDDGAGFIDYTDARIDVLYEHVPYNLQSDTYAYAGGESSRYVFFAGARGDAESYTIPGGSMKYLVDGGTALNTPPPHLVPVPYNLNVVRPLQHFSYTWERVPEAAFETGSSLFNRVYGNQDDPDEGITPFIGRINSAPFFGRGVGEVLFLGSEEVLTRAQTASGRRWRLRYNFLYAPSGHTWLRYFDPTGTTSGWYFVGAGTTFYDDSALPDNYSIVTGCADLNLLFSVN